MEQQREETNLMASLKRFRLWRTATLIQQKEIAASPIATDEEVIAASDGVPWNTLHVVETTKTIVESD